MAENGKNRLAIFTIFCLRRTDVNLREFGIISNCFWERVCYANPFSKNKNKSIA